ncbi:MAG: cobalamin-dependent protein, partial [Candidatus Margulisiibacteriota bacterium]
RINPTNRKDIPQDLKEGKTNIIRRDAVSQVAAGADMLDINVGFPETDEAASMKKAVLTVQSCTSVPVCLDSADPLALEEGLKNYAGKALINSVNAKEESLNAVLPLAKKYGAAIIGLTLDKSGIKSGAKERFEIAKKIVDRAVKEGISKEDIFIDVLTLSAGAQQKDVLETLKAVKMAASKLKVKTILGVSNVSHGLPGRKLLNAAFLLLCKEYGLNAAIYNPENLKVKLTTKQYKEAKAVFLNADKGAGEWIKAQILNPKSEILNKSKISNPKERNILEKISDSVIFGNKEEILGLIEEALREKEPQSIIDGALLPGIEEVGKRFNSGEYFIPQVMASAETMKTGFERVKKEIKQSERKNAGTVIIATVLGDIHDIGKNIVAMLMENHGFKVIDLGKDVPPEKIIQSAKENKADIIMLSALLTTTMPGMKAVKQALEKEGLNISLMVGGAPVTESYASSFGANFAKDAIAAVERAKGMIASH